MKLNIFWNGEKITSEPTISDRLLPKQHAEWSAEMERRKIGIDRNETTLQQLFPWNFILKNQKPNFTSFKFKEFYQLLEETEAFYKNKIEI